MSHGLPKWVKERLADPSQRDSGNSIINAEFPGDVLEKGIKILSAGAAAVEVHAGNVGQLANAADVRNRHVKAANAGGAAYAGKWVRQVGGRGMIVEAKSEVVARRPEAGTPAPTAIWRRSSAKIVHQAYVEIIHCCWRT